MCGKAACTDLCGGRRVTAVPTATRAGTPAGACAADEAPKTEPGVPVNRDNLRVRTLESFRAGAAVRDELLEYNKNVFDRSALPSPLKLPLPDEPFVAAWEEYAAEARRRGTLPTLKEKLVQLRFPIQEGISETESYRAATRRGIGPEIEDGDGITLRRPELFEIVIHPTPAGKIPLLVIGDRQDFATILRALARRNEPAPIPASQGALMAAGYNNWDRIRKLKHEWEQRNPEQAASDTGWNEEFKRIIPQKPLYQDRFIFLSGGPYSGIPADQMGMEEDEWRTTSLTIRREHECAHYFTRRMFSSMRNNVLDELIADYMGIVAAAGSYRADWFLRFIGLEAFPEWRQGSRLEIYRGELSGQAFSILQHLVKSAAENVETFDREHPEMRASAERGLPILVLSEFTLEELASTASQELLLKALGRNIEALG